MFILQSSSFSQAAASLLLVMFLLRNLDFDASSKDPHLGYARKDVD